ncbi:hypothetical protein D9M68_671580 [compost metagenome]
MQRWLWRNGICWGCIVVCSPGMDGRAAGPGTAVRRKACGCSVARRSALRPPHLKGDLPAVANESALMRAWRPQWWGAFAAPLRLNVDGIGNAGRPAGRHPSESLHELCTRPQSRSVPPAGTGLPAATPAGRSAAAQRRAAFAACRRGALAAHPQCPGLGRPLLGHGARRHRVERAATPGVRRGMRGSRHAFAGFVCAEAGRPGAEPVRHARAEGRAPAADLRRQPPLVPGLFRARLRF